MLTFEKEKKKVGEHERKFFIESFLESWGFISPGASNPPAGRRKTRKFAMKKQKNAQISEKTPRTCKISRSPSWTGARQQTIPRHLCFSPRNGRNPAVHIVSGSKVKRKLGANSEKGRKESWGLPKRKSGLPQCSRPRITQDIL